MKTPTLLLRNAFSGLALSAVVLLANRVSAAPPDPVEAAERAYEEVDFETQLAQATRALEAGHHDPTTLGNIYRLLGIAHAALNSSDAAKRAFMKLLAINPDIALEQVLSPRLRTPYMEARGFWDVSRERLDLELAIDPASGALAISLSDPLQMGSRVRVRPVDDAAHTIADVAAEPRIVVGAEAIAPHAGKPVQLELLDPYANVILVRVVVPPGALGATKAAGVPSPRDVGSRTDAAPPTLSLVLGSGALLGLGVGVTAHVVRENKAREWNGAACEQVGRGSRADQCGGVDDQRRSAQNIAVVAYAVSGALLAASVAGYLLALDGDAEPEPGGSRLACGVSSHGGGLHCSTIW